MKTNNKTTAEAPNNLLSELNALVTEGEKLIREASRGGKGEGDESIREHLDHANVRLHELYDDTKTQVTEKAKRADASIRSNPYQSLAIAVGIGLLIGVLTKHRSA